MAYQGNARLGFDWDAAFNTVINTAGQILKPGSPSTIPTYTPGTYATSQVGTSSGPWILGLGALALVLFMRKR